MVTVLFNVFLGTPPPLGGFLMVYVSCATDIAPALSMVNESPESDLMKRPPRNPHSEHIVDAKLIPLQSYFFLGNLIALGCFINYFYYWHAYAGLGLSDVVLQWSNFGTTGKSLAIYNIDKGVTLNNHINTAASVYFISIVYLNMFGNMLSTRTRHLSILQHNPIFGKTRNPYTFVAMVISTLLAVVILYIPPLQCVFSLSPVPVEFYFTAIAMGMVVIIADEIRRLIVRTFPNSFVAKIAW